MSKEEIMGAEKMYPQSTLDAVCAGLHFQIAQAKLKCARAKGEDAARSIELEQIRCRFAELEAQHDPLAGILTMLGIEVGSVEYEPARKMVLRAARFVVFGHRE